MKAISNTHISRWSVSEVFWKSFFFSVVVVSGVARCLPCVLLYVINHRVIVINYTFLCCQLAIVRRAWPGQSWKSNIFANKNTFMLNPMAPIGTMNYYLGWKNKQKQKPFPIRQFPLTRWWREVREREKKSETHNVWVEFHLLAFRKPKICMHTNEESRSICLWALAFLLLVHLLLLLLRRCRNMHDLPVNRCERVFFVQCVHLFRRIISYICLRNVSSLRVRHGIFVHIFLFCSDRCHRIRFVTENPKKETNTNNNNN